MNPIPLLVCCACSHVWLCNSMDCNPSQQASVSMEFSRQEYWSWLLFPLPRDLPNPGTEPTSLASPAFSRWSLYHWASWEASFPLQQMRYLEHIGWCSVLIESCLLFCEQNLLMPANWCYSPVSDYKEKADAHEQLTQTHWGRLHTFSHFNYHNLMPKIHAQTFHGRGLAHHL